MGQAGRDAAEYPAKGSHVNIVGRLRNNNYEKDGETVYGMAFTAEEIDHLDSRAESEARRNGGQGSEGVPTAHSGEYLIAACPSKRHRRPPDVVVPGWSLAARILLPLPVMAGGAAAVSGYGMRKERAGLERGQAAERELARAAIDDANMRAAQAGHRYEEWKARQAPRVITITREVSRALEAAPDWRDARLPDGVRDAI